MSFTTRCPACGTMFKVVADQLKISDGWVRCGHCADVFDATLYLQEPPASLPAGTPPQAAPRPGPSKGERAAPEDRPAVRLSVQKVRRATPASADRPTVGAGRRQGVAAPPARVAKVAQARSMWPDSGPAALNEAAESGWLLPPGPPPGEVPDLLLSDLEISDGHIPSAFDELPAAPSARPRGPSRVATGAESVAVPPIQTPPVARSPRRQGASPKDTGFAPLDGKEATDSHRASLSGWTESAHDSVFHEELERFAAAGAQRAPARPGEDPPPSSQSMDLTPGDDPVPHRAPGFVLQARRQAFWRSAPVQGLMLLLAVGFALLLALQWVVFDRDRLAAAHPALAPWLNRLCEPLACQIAAPRDIHAVVIDSSQLVRRLGSFYAFNLVLRNQAPMAVAMPALELTLTDSRDTVIARRVFLLGDLPGAPAALAPASTWPVEMRLSLNDADAQAMTGYRALVFYP